jgi:hypothetical protein
VYSSPSTVVQTNAVAPLSNVVTFSTFVMMPAPACLLPSAEPRRKTSPACGRGASTDFSRTNRVSPSRGTERGSDQEEQPLLGEKWDQKPT